MSLEDKIKNLLMEEGYQVDKKKSDEDSDDQDDDKKDMDDSDEDDVGSGKKDKVEVKEGSAPGQSKVITAAGSEEGGETKTSKLKAALSKKDSSGSLKDTASADKQDDNGDNAKLKAKLGNKDGKEAISGQPASGGSPNPDQNRNHVVTNPSGVKEHMDALFSGEELSEEFQSKAATIFEAAVAQATEARIEALEEEYAERVVAMKAELEESVNNTVDEIVGELVEEVDGYLDFVVGQWVAENEIALESSIKVELVDSFIDGLKNLFKEHNIDVPEEQIHVVEEQAKDIEALVARNAELEEANTALSEEVVTLTAVAIFEEVAEGLTKLQRDRFLGLAENVEFTTEEDYAKKLGTIKESYFPNGKDVIKEQKEVVNEPEKMDDYVKAISNKIKF